MGQEVGGNDAPGTFISDLQTFAREFRNVHKTLIDGEKAKCSHIFIKFEFCAV